MDFDAIVRASGRRSTAGKSVNTSPAQWSGRDFVNQASPASKSCPSGQAARDAAKAKPGCCQGERDQRKSQRGNAARSSQNAAAASSASAAAEFGQCSKDQRNQRQEQRNRLPPSAANAKTRQVSMTSADSIGTSVATCTAKAKEAEASAGKAAASEKMRRPAKKRQGQRGRSPPAIKKQPRKVVNTDKTLTIDGAPADAKAVGDKFKEHQNGLEFRDG